jgi:hypothetical protein
MGTRSFSGVKRPEGGGNHSPHPHLAPKSKKECSYTSAPPLGLRGLVKGELYIQYTVLIARLAAVARCTQSDAGYNAARHVGGAERKLAIGERKTRVYARLSFKLWSVSTLGPGVA